LRYFNGGRYMIPDLRSSRGKSTTSEIGFYPGDLEERLTGGTQQTTGLTVRYEAVKVSRLLSRKDLVRYDGDLEIYSLMDREPVEIGKELRCGD